MSMDLFTLWTLLVIIHSILYLQIVDCFDIHLNENWSESSSILLLNMSLGEGWTYSIEYEPKGIPSEEPKAAIWLNSTSGTVYLQKSKVCHISQNPVSFRLASTKWVEQGLSTAAETTTLPFNLVFHNLPCTFKTQRNLLYKRPISPLLIDLYGDYFSTRENQRCFEKGIVDIMAYIPQSLQSSICGVYVINQNFQVDRHHRITALSSLCSENKHKKLVIYGVIKGCDGRGTPFKITFQARDRRLSGSRRLTRHTAQENRSKRDASGPPLLFVRDSYNASVLENKYNGTFVTLVSIDDPEGIAINPEFSLLGDDADVFTVASPGIIRTSRPLDREEKSDYEVTVTVLTGDNREYFDLAKVFITIKDENDNAPQFLQDIYHVTVDEIASANTSIITLLAIDADEGLNAELNYTFGFDSDVQREFTIQTFQPYVDAGNVAEIRLFQPLDREYKDNYVLSVIAYDHGDPRLTSSAQVIVKVRDFNDNAPRFEQYVYTVSMFEDVALGTFVLNVSAVDADEGHNALVKYRMDDRNDGAGDFEIDGNSGEIRVVGEIDRELRDVYVLNVIAYDGGAPSRSSVAEVRVLIQDLNDNPPRFSREHVIVDVLENKAAGSVVVKLKAFDADIGENAVVEYFIEERLDKDKFMLEDPYGEYAVILTKETFDYESNETEFEISLRASSGHLFTTILIQIYVQDANDHAPMLNDFTIIFNNYDGNFVNIPIGKIPAYDPDVSDSGKLTFLFLTGNKAGFLHLDQSTGQITLDPRLNSHVRRSGSLQVLVSDGLHEVRATCSLHTRLITREMLESSITIRFLNTEAISFLSQLVSLLTETLTTIFETKNDNVFIISMKNITYEQQEVLEITVAILEKTVQVNRKIVDVFYTADHLTQMIESNRAFIEERVTLQVLPFAHDICALDPCPEPELCRSHLAFDKAVPFISTGGILFRSIHPKKRYRCVCPDYPSSMSFCSPCHENCTTENGFQCERTTGVCSCLDNYYQSPGSSSCLPCDCYEPGSESSQCDAISGQCPCLPEIWGKTCDRCPYRYDEIRFDEEDGVYGCKEAKYSCPRSFHSNIWWETEVTGVVVEHNCPNGATGTATRYCCTDRQWNSPDLFNCTSPAFGDLEVQIVRIESHDILLNTQISEAIISQLAEATKSKEPLFGKDIDISLRILNNVLTHENTQSGLSLTSEQDRNFLANLVFILNDILDEKYSAYYDRINSEVNTTSQVVIAIDLYLSTLLHTMETTSRLFNSPKPVFLYSENVVLGIETLDKTSFNGKMVPSNDIVNKSIDLIDDGTNAFLHSSSIRAVMPNMNLATDIDVSPKAYVGYVMYCSPGNLLPKSYTHDLKDTPAGKPLSVNSPVLSVKLRDEQSDITGPLSDPVVVTFIQQSSGNFSNPRCGYWQEGSGRQWSSEGCSVFHHDDRLVKCRCERLARFALLMEAPPVETNKQGCKEDPISTISTVPASKSTTVQHLSTLPPKSTLKLSTTTHGSTNSSGTTVKTIATYTQTQTTIRKLSTLPPVSTTALLPTPSLPTSAVTVSSGSCVVNNTVYRDRQNIQVSPDHCHGMVCRNGSMVRWEDYCYNNPPPPCDGWSEEVPRQCCPVCRHQVTTTGPLPDGACFHKGQMFHNYERFDTDPSGCHGYMCYNGAVQYWRKPCFITQQDCNGTLVNVNGECCPICRQTTDQQSSTSSTVESSTGLNRCTIRNKTYALNSRTNSDPCNKCTCTVRGEVCVKVTCGNELVCDTYYRPNGKCCFICGASARTLQSVVLIVLLTFLCLTLPT